MNVWINDISGRKPDISIIKDWKTINTLNELEDLLLHDKIDTLSFDYELDDIFTGIDIAAFIECKAVMGLQKIENILIRSKTGAEAQIIKKSIDRAKKIWEEKELS